MDLYIHHSVPGSGLVNEFSYKRYVIQYIVGFFVALLLSVVSYLVATNGWFATAQAGMMALLFLAVVQLITQLVLFLHLSIHGRGMNRVLTLAITLIMMMIIVVGSLWIMKNLDYRMGMSSEAMNEYMKTQNTKGF
jgi:cytochrome o ubiquinol oxidase subunit IV